MKVVKNPIVGQKVGRLTLYNIENGFNAFNRPKSIAHCVCDCGSNISFPLCELGNKKSCGCLRGEQSHKKSHTKVWAAWQKMKSRCYNKNCPKYISYGARGIMVCEGLHSFKHFFKILGEPPSKSHSNDRIDNNRSYTCGECNECIKKGWMLNIHWATPKEQSQNQRTNHKVVYNGEQMCLVEAARKAMIPYKTLFARVSNGWDFDIAIKTPLGKPHSYKKIKHGTVT